MMGKMLVFAALVFLFGFHTDTSAVIHKKMFTRRLILCAVVLLMVFVRPLSAAVEFVLAGTAAYSTGSITPAWPAHLSGDIGLLFVESCGSQAVTLSTPAGFENVLNSPQTTGEGPGDVNGTRITVFWCRATSSSMSSPTVADPGNHVYGIILTFRGVTSTGNPWDVTAGGAKATTSTTTTFGTVTTTVDNDLIVLAVSRNNDLSAAAWSNWTNANLSSLLERSDGGTTQGNGGGIGVATGIKSTAGAIGSSTAAVTPTTVDGHITIALKPPTPPGQATNPTPTNGATDVSLTQDLSWTAGSGTVTSRDVYFDTVNPPVTKVIADGTALTYDTGTMAASTIYYWRVDEKNADGTTTGVVWSFTTTGIMYWSGNFSTIALASIGSRTQTCEGSSQVTLTTSGNAEISADNTAAARLTKAGGATLYTEYKLTFDGDGVSTTGGSTVDFTSYDLFLNPSHAIVTHISSDDAVQVTLYARASNYTGQLADAGDYNSVQTLTVSWIGP